MVSGADPKASPPAGPGVLLAETWGVFTSFADFLVEGFAGLEVFRFDRLASLELFLVELASESFWAWPFLVEEARGGILSMLGEGI